MLRLSKEAPREETKVGRNKGPWLMVTDLHRPDLPAWNLTFDGAPSLNTVGPRLGRGFLHVNSIGVASRTSRRRNSQMGDPHRKISRGEAREGQKAEGGEATTQRA